MKEKILCKRTAVVLAFILILTYGLLGALWRLLFVAEIGLVIYLLFPPQKGKGKKKEKAGTPEHTAKPEEPQKTKKMPTPGAGEVLDSPLRMENTFLRVQEFPRDRRGIRDTMESWDPLAGMIPVETASKRMIVVEFHENQPRILGRTPQGQEDYYKMEPNIPVSISHAKGGIVVLTWIV